MQEFMCLINSILTICIVVCRICVLCSIEQAFYVFSEPTHLHPRMEQVTGTGAQIEPLASSQLLDSVLSSHKELPETEDNVVKPVEPRKPAVPTSPLPDAVEQKADANSGDDIINVERCLSIGLPIGMDKAARIMLKSFCRFSSIKSEAFASVKNVEDLDRLHRAVYDAIAAMQATSMYFESPSVNRKTALFAYVQILDEIQRLPDDTPDDTLVFVIQRIASKLLCGPVRNGGVRRTTFIQASVTRMPTVTARNGLSVVDLHRNQRFCRLGNGRIMTLEKVYYTMKYAKQYPDLLENF